MRVVRADPCTNATGRMSCLPPSFPPSFFLETRKQREILYGIGGRGAVEQLCKTPSMKLYGTAEARGEKIVHFENRG